VSGAASRTRGLVTEQMEVRWFRAHGFPRAERVVRTGYRTPERALPDAGDIALCPGVIVASKSLRPVNRAERAVPGWLTETEAQRVAAGAEVALLVVRRDGTADVGEWFCWLPYGWCCGLVNGPPCRLLVRDACVLLRNSGYGSPLSEEGTA
jgi:hypothetical protein